MALPLENLLTPWRQFPRNRALFPIPPSKKSWGFGGRDWTLLHCHATPPSAYARPVTPHNPPLSLGFPPTQGKPGRALPALGFALRSGPSGLFATARTLPLCHATPPSADARPVTPHNPPLSLGFPTTQGKPGRALPALGFALRSSPSEGRRGSDASLLPSDSEQPLRASPACHGYSSLQSNRAAPGASHFF